MVASSQMSGLEAQYVTMETPLGELYVEATGDYISQVRFVDSLDTATTTDATPFNQSSSSPLLTQACTQLQEYFQGQRKQFDLPLAQQGTDFQQTVWSALQQIPYGNHCSYQQLANAIRNEKAVRAVGAANGKNKLFIVVPCHRVIGKDGSLSGYAGGVERKRWLLALEQKSALR